MFKKSERLSRAAFTEYFKIGRRYQTPALTLVHQKSSKLAVSAVVGKKVAKLAVGRNRIRRRLYAGMRRTFNEGGIKNGVFIVIAKPAALKYERSALATELATLLALPFRKS